MNVPVVLLDADGVIQRTPDAFRRRLASLVPPAQAQAFLQAVFAAEAGPLIGVGRFETELETVLATWGVTVPVTEVLATWSLVEPIEGLATLVQNLWARDIRCYVASNQQALRARVLTDDLGYGRVFEGAFYSCDLGARKPDPAFFRAVLARLETDPGSVVFVDDDPVNVRAASAAGLRAVHFRLDNHVDPRRALERSIAAALATIG